MNIFVTGSTGTIGQEVVRELSTKGVPFKVGVTSVVKKSAGLASVVIDYRDAKTLAQAFSSVDVLFLLTPDPPEAKTWVENAVNAARQAGVQHIVRSSGIGASINSPYEVMKHLGELEQIVENSSVTWTLLRPNSFMQNFATFESQAIRNGNLHAPRGDASISFVDVRDIANVAVTVLLNPEAHAQRAYTLTGPRALTPTEVVSVIGEKLGKDVTYTDVSEEAWAEQMRAYLSEWDIRLLLSLYQADKDGITAPVTTAVEQVTGRPSRTFEAFVSDYAYAWSGDDESTSS